MRIRVRIQDHYPNPPPKVPVPFDLPPEGKPNRAILSDPNLSWKVKGVYMYFVSHRPTEYPCYWWGWENKPYLLPALQELERHGYLIGK